MYQITPFTCTFRDWKCTVVAATYTNNDRWAILLIDSEDHTPIATASVNLPDVPLEDNQILIKTWSENEGIELCLMDAGVITENPLGYVPTGFTTALVAELTPEFLKEIQQ